MIELDDPRIIENTRKVREYEKKRKSSWRDGLSPERIKDLEDNHGYKGIA